MNFRKILLLSMLLLTLTFALIMSSCDGSQSTDSDTSTGAVTDTGAATDNDSSTGSETVNSADCGHNSTEYVTVKAATCTEKGSENKVCTICGKVLEVIEVNQVAHTEVILSGKTPTCSQEGLTEGKKCSVCNTVLVAQTTVAKLNHTEKIIDGVSATCLAEGKTTSKECSVCGIVITASETIEKLNHTEQIIESIAATCTEKGSTAGKDCSVCGTIILSVEEVEALGHNESDWIVDSVAQIGVDGRKHTECIRCNELIKTETIPALTEEHVHSGSEWVITTQPTCNEEGVRTHICECGFAMETESVDKTPHSEEIIPETAATCSSTGLTSGKKCSECGEITVSQTIIEKLPHTEEIIPGTTPTCTTTGLTEGKKCSVCGTTIVSQSTIAKADHTEETILGKAPTCTEYGTSDGSKCSVCTATITAQIPIPPTGHDFETGTCKNCGINRTYGIWIIDGLGNPVSNVFVKILKDGQQISMHVYDGSYLTFDLDLGTYTFELDLSQTGKDYVYDASVLTVTPDNRHATVKLYETAPRGDEKLYVGYPIDTEYDSYQVGQGSYRLDITSNDYTFIVFRPTVAAIYTITYECDEDLTISYHGSSFFVQGADLSESSTNIGKFGNGLFVNIYSSNIGGDFVFAIKSEGATSCVLNIANAGDPGTRLEDQPWTPYLEDAADLEKHLAVPKEGTYSTIDVTDMSISAVFNEDDGYYHLNTANGPILFIDLTTDSRFISSIQTICANQRMGAYIYDINGDISEKRSYNELFIQYGMPDTADKVDDPIRVPLTAKLAEAIKSFGDKNSWWAEGSEANIFDKVLLGATYNREYAWLLYCGYYS